MKRITNYITHGQEFIFTSTAPEDEFAKLGKFVAFRSEDVTGNQTNRVLHGLDVLSANTLPELMKNCNRSMMHAEWMKAHPMPPENSPEFKTWLETDFAEWSKVLLA